MSHIDAERPIILLTNDDGVNAKGIHALAEAVSGLAQIVVVAPDGARSGQSGAITPNQVLRVMLQRTASNYWEYATTGTPVDCVKLALDNVLPRHPDLILSGINHGLNSGVSILYSGTMGAVLEGCVMQIPSIGFSLDSFSPDADFAPAQKFVRRLVKRVLSEGLPKCICLNVNIPKGDDIAGVRVVRQTSGCWTQEYTPRVDEQGRSGYWLGGSFHNRELEAEDTDEWALSHGYISVVPCRVDMTAYDALESLKQIEEI